MKRVSVTIAVALGAVFGLPSCDDEESDGDKVKRIVEDLVGESNQQVEIVCDCYEELGFDDRADCKEEVGEILPARQRCIEAAYEQDVAAVEQHFDCRQPLEAEYTTCLNSKLECDEAGSADACGDDYDTGLDTCIALPNSVNRDVQECFDND